MGLQAGAGQATASDGLGSTAKWAAEGLITDDEAAAVHDEAAAVQAARLHMACTIAS